jgi:hypothetical protein
MTNLSFPSAVIILTLACSWHIVHSFTTTPLLTSRITSFDTSFPSRNNGNGHVLCAKKQSNKSKPKKNVSSSGGGGFGAKAVVSTENKVRSVSGHAGSGEKPLRQAANTFDAIRKEHGKEWSNDVYCYSPLNDEETFWYVGKIAFKPGTAATALQAALSQKRLIFEYSKRELRPQNLGGKYASALELWLAPGDSEMDAVQNKISLTKVEGTTKDLLPDFSVKDVGYNPEIYVGDEVEKGGLRVKRNPTTGEALKPVFEVNESM